MANTRFKVDHGLAVTGNAEFYQRIDAHANAFFNNDLFVVSGNLTVNGTIVYANVVVGNGGIRAIADQQDIGNTSNRFNLFGYRVQVDDSLVPLQNNIPMGNTTRRWEIYANNLNTTTITVGATSLNATYYDATAKSANTINGLYANGIVVRTSNTSAVAREIEVSSNGIVITNGNGVSGNPTLNLVFGSGMFANASGMFVNLSSVTVGTLPIARGGTGGPDRESAINNLLPTQNAATVDYVLRSNGSSASWVAAVGPQGYTGSQGTTGFVGSRGDLGYTGSAGTNGFNGSVGFTGSAGPIGFTGSRGDTGFVGSRGFTGSAGLDAQDGFTGSRGFTGSQGSVGFIGSQGFTGSQGAIGYTGSKGDTGAASTVQGPIGYTGSTGFTGSRGFTGSAGTDAVLTASLSGSGYVELSNGLIFQWGSVYRTSMGYSLVSLPTSFAGGAYQVIASIQSGGPDNGDEQDEYIYGSAYSASQIAVYVENASGDKDMSGVTISFFAVGY